MIVSLDYSISIFISDVRRAIASNPFGNPSFESKRGIIAESHARLCYCTSFWFLTWLTDALYESIKRKNRCVRNEMNYMRYKCKLKKRHAEKMHMYYHKLLLKYNVDTRKSWAMIKNVINKNKNDLVQTKFRLNEGLQTNLPLLINLTNSSPVLVNTYQKYSRSW